MAIVRIRQTVDNYNTTTGLYENERIDSYQITSSNEIYSENVAIVAGTGKTLVAITGTYYVQVYCADATAILTLRVGATDTMHGKTLMGLIVSDQSVFVDASKNCTIKYKLIKIG